MEHKMTFQIRFSDLWTYKPDAPDERIALGASDDEVLHIHGFLDIEVAGRKLPYLGYFGEDDVCFNAWVAELVGIQRRLETDGEVYVYDEGEQGQPAFKFARSASQVSISIVDSPIGDGEGDPDWEDVPCDWKDLDTAITQFVEAIQSTVRSEVGEAKTKTWAGKILRQASGG